MQVGQARSVINTMTMRQNNWTLGTYCETYCRIVTGHHSLEDHSMFPRLRAHDPALAPVVDRLPRSTSSSTTSSRRSTDASWRWSPPSPRRRRRGPRGARRQVDLLTDTLLSHLAYEERELLHPLARFGMV